jgi:hypothetical protein
MSVPTLRSTRDLQEAVLRGGRGGGMSTYLWGPDAHELHHGVADELDPENAAAVDAYTRFVVAIPVAMPCIHCRLSCASFVEAQERADGVSLTEVARSGGASEWMHRLHETINDKLDLQAFDEAMAPVYGLLSQRLGVDVALLQEELRAATVASGAFRGKRLPYSAYRKRVIAFGEEGRLARFQAARVFRFLRVCAFVMDSQRLAGFIQYVRALGDFVEATPLLRERGPPRMGKVLQALALRMQRAWKSSDGIGTAPNELVCCSTSGKSNVIFDAVIAAENMVRGTRQSMEAALAETQRFSAKSCSVKKTCV